MMLKPCVCAVVVLVAVGQAAMLPAQQLVQPGAPPGQVAWPVQRLPRVGNEFPPNTASASLQGAAVSQNPAAPGPGTGVVPLEPPLPVVDEAELDESKVVELAPSPPPRRATGLGDFWGYRYEQASMDWIVGDDFGMFSLNGDHYQQAGVESGIGVGIDINWISGPGQSDMPPRLYDFSLAYQCRRQFGPFAYDVAASVMASSDFEGSAREGIRFPAHAVGFLQICPTAELAFGVDYLDRGDIKLLPVAGLIWNPRDDVRLELLFPRPRATFRLPECIWPTCGKPAASCDGTTTCDTTTCGGTEHRLYIAGELGGGTWAVERHEHNDLATYRDLRLSVGLECVDTGGSRSAIELSYLFGRRLEFTSAEDNLWLDDTLMIRWIASY